VRLLQGAQQVVSELPRFRLGFFYRFKGHQELILWRSCVNLRSAIVLFVGSCVDLRTTQGVLRESSVELIQSETQSRVSGRR